MLEQLTRCQAAHVPFNSDIIIKGADTHNIIQSVRVRPVAEVHGELLCSQTATSTSVSRASTNPGVCANRLLIKGPCSESGGSGCCFRHDETPTVLTKFADTAVNKDCDNQLKCTSGTAVGMITTYMTCVFACELVFRCRADLSGRDVSTAAAA
jgi:hypothetical protein